MTECIPLVGMLMLLVNNTRILCVDYASNVVSSVIDLRQLFRLSFWFLLINPFFCSHLDHFPSIPYQIVTWTHMLSKLLCKDLESFELNELNRFHRAFWRHAEYCRYFRKQGKRFWHNFLVSNLILLINY